MLNLYYWEADGLMTAAFGCKHGKFGLAFPLSDNKVQKDMDKKKLVASVSETMDAILHHGVDILDSKKNIDLKKLNDAEARKFALDPTWKEQVANFYARLQVKEVTKQGAKTLELI